MRILKKVIDGKNGSGFVRAQCDDAEDMYHLYNLIGTGDLVHASTIRGVSKESKTGSVDKSRVRMNLKIRVERVEFDAEQCSLRLCGRNVEENEFVKMGQYHTLDLELDHPFTIEKECWDQVYMDRLGEACNPAGKAELAAVVMQEGLAHVCLITSTLTITRCRIEKPVPKKRPGDTKTAEKSTSRFFSEILEAVRKHVNFDVVKAMIVGSPGFLKEDFLKFLVDTATRQGDSALLKQRSKIILTHATSGHRNAIDDLLSNPALTNQLLDVKAAAEVKALKDFNTALTQDADRAAYGLKHVCHAHDSLAIAQLLVTDSLFKSADFNARRRYVSLAEDVRKSGGKVFIFSSMHVSGAQLDAYTGIAAILRFPVPDWEEAAEVAFHGEGGGAGARAGVGVGGRAGEGKEGKEDVSLCITREQMRSFESDSDTGSSDGEEEGEEGSSGRRVGGERSVFDF